MKHSIDKIFRNLIKLQFIILLLTIFGSLFIYSQYDSYKKIAILENQQNSISKIFNEQKKSTTFNIIQFNSDIAQFKEEIDRLVDEHKNSFSDKYFMDNVDQHTSDLYKLKNLIQNFNELSRDYYKISADDENFQELFNNIETIYYSLYSHINNMKIKNISYDNNRFGMFIKVYLLLLILMITTTFWYRGRLQNIYSDILLLISVDNKKTSSDIFSTEADAISLRMKRKPSVSKNPAYIDSVTDINNNKGMLQEYSEKKGLKENNFYCVTVIEIDNFSKSNRAFSQEFTQEILKKVAYSISLHQQSTDVIARTDYNQFTIIFSRASKDQLFKDIDLIRQSVSEIKLMSPERESINVTVTGGFILKAKNSPLDDSIRKAKELLKNAKENGLNKIYQSNDLIK